MTDTAQHPPCRFLYVEDSPGDTEFMRIACKRISPEVSMTVVPNADETMKFLRHEQPYEGSVQPDLIILDLKLPGKSGLEILAEIKATPQWRRIPVIMLTSSRLQEDVSRAYDSGANCYLAKPHDAAGYQDTARAIYDFWINHCLLPPNTGGRVGG